MSRTLGSIFNPQAPEALAIVLGRQAFLRELFVAFLLSLSLPMVSVAVLYLYLHSSGMNLIGFAIILIFASALTAIPILFYASLRLNAATLARERASQGVAEQIIHKPLEGPLLLRNSIVAGSVKSRIIAGFPVNIAFGMEFALLDYLMSSNGFLLFNVLIGVIVVVQIVTALDLLR